MAKIFYTMALARLCLFCVIIVELLLYLKKRRAGAVVSLFLKIITKFLGDYSGDTGYFHFLKPKICPCPVNFTGKIQGFCYLGGKFPVVLEPKIGPCPVTFTGNIQLFFVVFLGSLFS